MQNIFSAERQFLLGGRQFSDDLRENERVGTDFRDLIEVLADLITMCSMNAQTKTSSSARTFFTSITVQQKKKLQ